MTMPTSSPTTTEQDSHSQLSMPNAHNIKKVAATMSTELRLVPSDRAPSRSFIRAFSLVRTAKMPTRESRMPTAAISMGAMTALTCISVSSAWRKAAAPNAAVARMEPQ